MLNSTCRAPSELPCDDDGDPRELQLGIDGRRQPERGPYSGAAEARDGHVDESPLLSEQREERALGHYGFAAFRLGGAWSSARREGPSAAA